MHCHEFEQRLDAMLDDREDPGADAALAMHARQCERCEQVLAGQEMLVGAMRELPLGELPAGFAGGVVARHVAEGAPRATGQARRWWVAAAVLLTSAAAALFAVSIAWQARRNDGEQAARLNETPAKGPRGRLLGGNLAVAQPGGLRRAATGSEHVGRGSSGWLIEATRLTDHVRESMDGLPSTLPETMERINQVEQVAPGIRPLRISFALIWDTIWRAFPAGQGSGAKEPEERTGATLFGGAAVA